MSQNKTSEKQHHELISLINPLVDFMNRNGFTYFIVAGKDGTCSRYMGGEYSEAAGMLTSFMESNETARKLLKESVADFESNANNNNSKQAPEGR